MIAGFPIASHAISGGVSHVGAGAPEQPGEGGTASYAGGGTFHAEGYELQGSHQGGSWSLPTLVPRGDWSACSQRTMGFFAPGHRDTSPLFR